MTPELLRQLVAGLDAEEQLCMLPISRVLVEEPSQLDERVILLPPSSVSTDDLRVVDWPAAIFSRTIGRPRDPGSVLSYEGDELHWVKSGATNIDLPEFFAEALLAFPVKLDWNALLEPRTHEHHLEMLRASMEQVERTLDMLRFQYCKIAMPQFLPGRAGLLGNTSFSAGLFYSRADHESYIVAGQIVTHQVIAGIGLDLSEVGQVYPLAEGEVGSIVAHALRLYTDALEASTETSRFVQMMSLIEFLADPSRFIAMKEAKRLIARQIARDRADYEAIIVDFFYLTSEGGAASGPNKGLRHNIVHCGKRLEDLTTASEREALFARLARYAGGPLMQLIEHAYEDWSFVEELRSRRATELGLTG